MQLQIKKRILFFIGAGIVIVLFFIIIPLSLLGTNTRSKQTTLTPTPFPKTNPANDPQLRKNPKRIQDSPEYVRTYEQAMQENKTILSRDAAVGRLLSKLPYRGTNFSLFYDYATNQFTAVISSTNQTQGNQEFDRFLKSNEIDNRSWVRNLLVKYQ